LKKALSLKGGEGVLIADVQEKSPAEQAGLKSGDVVTAVEKKSVASAGQFRNLIASSGADSKVHLSVVREGKPRSVTVHLGTLDKEEAATALPEDTRESAAEVEGLALKSLDDELRRRLQVPAGVKGAVIVRVTRGSKAERAKLQPGDVILQINHEGVDSAPGALALYGKDKGPKLLQILRKGRRSFVVVK
jgi:serine protease Do